MLGSYPVPSVSDLPVSSKRKELYKLKETQRHNGADQNRVDRAFCRRVRFVRETRGHGAN